MRCPAIHTFLKWAGPSFVVFVGGCIGLVAALAQSFPGVQTWAERRFDHWWPIVTSGWFLVSAALIICAFIVALIWTGQPTSPDKPGLWVLGTGSFRVEDAAPDTSRPQRSFHPSEAESAPPQPEPLFPERAERPALAKRDPKPAADDAPPLLFSGFVEAKDTPQKDHTAIRVNVRNQSRETLIGLVARLVRAEPALGSLDGAINLPLVLETKARLDRLRNPKINEQPPQQGFDLHPKSEKQIEVVWLHSRGALEGYITHQDGETSFLFVESLDLQIEVTGAGEPITAVVRINIDYNNNQEWTVSFIPEAALRADGKGSMGRREIAAVAQALDDQINEDDEKTLERLGAILPPDKMADIRAARTRDVTLAEALGYAAYGKWGKPFHGTFMNLGFGPNINDLLDEFTVLAADGTLTLWGKESASGVYRRVPKTHREGRLLTTTDAVGAAQIAGGAEPYRSLMLNRAEVEREWPHEG